MVWLIVSQLIYLVSLLPWFAIAGLSIMAFDSGYSTGAVVFVGAIWSYPVWVLVCSVLAWILYWQGKTTPALISTSVPLVLVLALVVFFIIVSVFSS